MKAIQTYKFFSLFFLIPILNFAITDSVGPSFLREKHTKEKVIKKSFNVASNATLKIDNSYGNLDIVSWNEDRIEIVVTITTKGNDEEKVQRKLDDIYVDFYGSSNLVSAKTIFNKSRSNSWWSWGGSNNVNMSINYVVKLPITNSIDLSNDYGSINVGKLEGQAIIKCDYGKITTKELMADNNRISFDYTSNCYFEYIKSGEINADYSGFTLAKAKNIKLNADYTSSIIETVENINYVCDYGSVKINRANNIQGNGDYLTVVIGDVYKNVSLDADYGSIKIGKMTSNAGNINIDSDYTGIKIGHASDYHFNFDIELEYASLSDSGDFHFNKKREESGEKYYSGYYGSSNSGNSIKIESEYGSVSFYKN
ncbi:hypothetical protein OS188_10150 [Xanthomarina sp. F1114]|uniref:hypothetical protein n=1 Tax=Xanthomarina sp. F1114 TaxID=2996019 RepID=UPI00225DDC29|nr:hypothetical protein [Xanthomarina sp. F1114]MCX7548312.1 hypothetical protein [Xanthomarina sp. F1114]